MPAAPKPSPFHVIPRTAWRARPGRSAMQDQAPPTEAFLHYSDSSDAARVDTQEEACAAARSIQAFHMDTRGWSDIAYHYLVVQLQGKGETLALAGRSPGKVPAAQLNHNTGTLAICVYAGPLDVVTPRTRYVIERLLIAHPQLRTLGGHRDVVATDCPGDHLYSLVPRIAMAAGLRPYRHAL